MRRFRFPTLLAAAVLAAGCDTADDAALGPVPVTRAIPAGGTFPISLDQRICLRSDRPAMIYFTLTGTVPDPQTANPRFGPTFVAPSPVCNIPIAFDGMPLQFFAIDTAGNQESVKLEQYRIDGPPICRATPEPGLYNRSLDVIIAADGGETAMVLYTTDGSEPEEANPNAQRGPAPLGPIPLAASTQLRWRCIDEAGNAEAVRSGQYQIDTEPPTSGISPPGGEFLTSAGEVPVEAKISITNNDTGLVYWTTNGGVPQPNDPQGHTSLAPLEARLTIAESTIVRFTSVDKAGNAEVHSDPAKPFNDAAFIIDNMPVVIASPPGGRYSEDSLEISLTGAPSAAVVTYSINGAPYQTWAGTPFTISGREVKLRLSIQLGAGLPVERNENYELGVATVTADFTEPFDNTNNLDLTASPSPLPPTTPVALIEGGAAKLPRVPVTTLGASFSTDEVIVSPTAVIADPYFAWAQEIKTNAGVIGGYAYALAGGPQNAISGHGSTGVQVYELGGSLPNAPAPIWRHTLPVAGAEFWHRIATLQTSSLMPLLAVAAGPPTPLGNAAALRFYKLDGSAPTTLGSADATTTITTFTWPFGFGVPTPSAPLVAPEWRPGIVLVNERVSNTSKITVLEVTGSTTLTVGRRGSHTLSGAPFVTAMHLVEDSIGITRLAIATTDCKLHIISADNLDNLGFTAGPTVCNTTDDPTAVVTVQLGGTRFALVAYGVPGPSAPGQVALVNLSTGVVVGAAILPSFRPSGPIWHMAVVNAPDSSSPVLAVSGGPDGVLFYDLADVPAIVAATKSELTYLQRATRADTHAYGLAAYQGAGIGNPSVFVHGFADDDADQLGDLGAWFLRVPNDLRDFVPAAFIQSTPLNPRSGQPIRALKFDTVDFSGDIQFEVSADGGSFAAFNCCSIRDFSPNANTIRWRATLRGGAESPVLRDLKLRFDYE